MGSLEIRIWLVGMAILMGLAFALARAADTPGPITTPGWPESEVVFSSDTASPCRDVKPWTVREIDGKTGAVRLTVLHCVVVDGVATLRSQ